MAMQLNLNNPSATASLSKVIIKGGVHCEYLVGVVDCILISYAHGTLTFPLAILSLKTLFHENIIKFCVIRYALKISRLRNMTVNICSIQPLFELLPL